MEPENIFTATEDRFLPNTPTQNILPDCILYTPVKCSLYQTPPEAPL